jgi:hypothetical protein
MMALRLPVELILDILTSALSAAPDTVLDAAHPTTKLFLSFSLVVPRDTTASSPLPSPTLRLSRFQQPSGNIP